MSRNSATIICSRNSVTYLIYYHHLKWRTVLVFVNEFNGIKHQQGVVQWTFITAAKSMHFRRKCGIILSFRFLCLILMYYIDFTFVYEGVILNLV